MSEEMNDPRDGELWEYRNLDGVDYESSVEQCRIVDATPSRNPDGFITIRPKNQRLVCRIQLSRMIKRVGISKVDAHSIKCYQENGTNDELMIVEIDCHPIRCRSVKIDRSRIEEQLVTIELLCGNVEYKQHSD